MSVFVSEDALFYRVKAFKGLKDYGRALECIDELIDINPGNEEYDNEKRDLLKCVRTNGDDAQINIMD